MTEEKPEIVEQEEEQEYSFYDEVRGDIETAVAALSALEEMDSAMYGKQLKQAKNDCVFIICRAIEILKESYEE